MFSVFIRIATYGTILINTHDIHLHDKIGKPRIPFIYQNTGFSDETGIADADRTQWSNGLQMMDIGVSVFVFYATTLLQTNYSMLLISYIIFYIYCEIIPLSVTNLTSAKQMAPDKKLFYP